MDKSKKNEKLKEYIRELSQQNTMSRDYCQNMLEKFESVYDDNFRHFYSDISSILLKSDICLQMASIENKKIDEKNNKEIISIDQLAENMRIFYEYAKENETEKINQIEKLNDHITMDIARINYWKKLNSTYIDLYKRSYAQIKTMESKLNISNSKLEKTAKKMNLANSKITTATKEATNVKKDLVSIMGIFLGIFLFFQLNFSQIKDLLEYDPFSRMIYLIMFNVIFLVGLYLIFVIIDFLIHREPRLLKLIINTEKKRPNMLGWVCIILYIGILGTCSSFLYSGNSRKTISKIENTIEESNESLNKKIVNEINEKNAEINDLKKKIIKLENEIQEIDGNNKKLDKEIKNTKIEKK